MVGFEQQNSGVGSNHSSNCVTTTSLRVVILSSRLVESSRKVPHLLIESKAIQQRVVLEQSKLEGGNKGDREGSRS